MQIVIDIDENAKAELDTYLPEFFYKFVRDWLCLYGCNIAKSIKNGIVLPKGHGELVDIRPLMRGLYEEIQVGELTYTTSEVYKMLEEETSTIIEADTER